MKKEQRHYPFHNTDQIAETRCCPAIKPYAAIAFTIRNCIEPIGNKRIGEPYHLDLRFTKIVHSMGLAEQCGLLCGKEKLWF